MRNYWIILLIVLTSGRLFSQIKPASTDGAISYISTEHVYVRFNSTDGINQGDTLNVSRGDSFVPALVVMELSSTSCVCKTVSGYKPQLTDKIHATFRITGQAKENDIQSEKKQIVPSPTISGNEQAVEKKKQQSINRHPVHGKLSAAAFTGLTNIPAGNDYRMKYTLSLNTVNIGNSKISAETYISFVHRAKGWETGNKNKMKGLQVYNLSVNFPITPHSKIWLGRKLNPRISNVGAIDGIQYEIIAKSISCGIIAGFRPDLTDNGFNGKLLQYGLYLGHDYTKTFRTFQSTLAFIEQQNSGKTDRRYLYFQHSGTLLRNLYVFGSLETDVFRIQADSVNNEMLFSTDYKPRLTNAYISLRYRSGRKLSASLSYSAVNNIIYYESFRNYIQRLTETNTFQGYQLQFNYGLFKNITIGTDASYRFQNADPQPEGLSYGKPAKSLYTYITFRQIPFLKANGIISSNILETSYISGKIYSVGLSKDLLPGKISSGIKYRYASYSYYFGNYKQNHHVGEADLTWRVARKYTLSFYIESIFQKNNQYHQMYLNLIKSF